MGGRVKLLEASSALGKAHSSTKAQAQKDRGGAPAKHSQGGNYAGSQTYARQSQPVAHSLGADFRYLRNNFLRS